MHLSISVSLYHTQPVLKAIFGGVLSDSRVVLNVEKLIEVQMS